VLLKLKSTASRKGRQEWPNPQACDGQNFVNVLALDKPFGELGWLLADNISKTESAPLKSPNNQELLQKLGHQAQKDLTLPPLSKTIASKLKKFDYNFEFWIS